MIRSINRWVMLVVGSAGFMVLFGCASTNSVDYHLRGKDLRDPYENTNRSVYEFNMRLDKAVFRPIARGYDAALPRPVKKGASNFFDNVADFWSLINNALQLKAEPAMSSFFRVAVNSTFGLGGVLDVASEMRLKRYPTDFGLTLGYWGVEPGPYLVLPLLGPSSVRDGLSLPVDVYGSPISKVSPFTTRISLASWRLVDKRYRLMFAGDVLENSALDPYIMMRDVYLNYRDLALRNAQGKLSSADEENIGLDAQTPNYLDDEGKIDDFYDDSSEN